MKASIGITLSPPEIREEFGKWLEKLPKVSSINHERYIFNDAKTPLLPEELFLHIFCDAGDSAFDIAAYIRYKSEGGYKSHLIFSSLKMAPTKNKLSIQKKELKLPLTLPKRESPSIFPLWYADKTKRDKNSKK